MKTTVITITTATYEAGDNTLYTEERVFSNEQQAQEKFNELCDAMHEDIYGRYDNEEDAEAAITEMRDGTDYTISREEGTEFEYQGRIEMRWNTVETAEPEECWLLYETDAWNSIGSRVLFGIYTSEERLLEGVRKLVADRLNNYRRYEFEDESLEDTQERIVTEFLNCHHQTQCYDVNLDAVCANLNTTEEI